MIVFNYNKKFICRDCKFNLLGDFMDFNEYSSIENSYREKYINTIIEQGHYEKQYVVTSKLDGANFSFICNGKQVIQASRNNKVGSDFFNCQIVINKYSEEIFKLFDIIKDNDDFVLKQIQVYGELIGDGINNRVKYCKDREFFIFDIYITDNENHTTFIKYDDLTLDLQDLNLKVVPEHFTGTLKECLEYCEANLVFKSHIPDILDNEYKLLETNWEEGFVIRPIEELKLFGRDRIILKVKSPEFKEKGQNKKQIKIPVELSDTEKEVLNKLNELVTESRVYSVTSKLGQLTANDFGKVVGLYTKDLFEEFLKDNKDIEISRPVNKQLSKLITNCIREVWINILEQ